MKDNAIAEFSYLKMVGRTTGPHMQGPKRPADERMRGAWNNEPTFRYVDDPTPRARHLRMC